MTSYQSFYFFRHSDPKSEEKNPVNQLIKKFRPKRICFWTVVWTQKAF